MSARRSLLWIGGIQTVLGLMTTLPSLFGPPSDGPTDAIAEALAGDPGSYLGLSYLAALTWCTGLILFFAFLRSYALEHNETRAYGAMIDVGWGGALTLAPMLATVGALGLLTVHTFVHAGPELRTQLALGLQILTNFTAFPTVLAVFGFGVAMRGLGTMGKANALFSLVVGVCHLLSAANFSLVGAMRPSGPFALAAPVLFSLWIGVATLTVKMSRPPSV